MGMESSATPLQRRVTSWRKLHTAAEEEDYFVEETGAEDDDTVEDDEPDHEPCEEVSVLNKWQFSRQMHNGIGEWQARKQFAQDRRRLSALASIHEDAAATFENDKDRTEVENASSTLGADSIEAILMSSDSSDNRVCLDSEKE